MRADDSGLDIGLWRVRNLVKTPAEAIAAASPGAAGGSTFTVCLLLLADADTMA